MASSFLADPKWSPLHFSEHREPQRVSTRCSVLSHVAWAFGTRTEAQRDSLNPDSYIAEDNPLQQIDLANHPLAERFALLTPEHVLDAVEVQGRRCTGRFIILNSYENRVYQLELDDGQTVVGKFYRPGRWSKEAIADEHTFLKELAEDEIPVASPLEIAPGETIGEIMGIHYTLFPRIGGRIPQELNDQQIQILGRLVARIHNVGARNSASNRPQLTPEYYGLENLEYLEENDVLPFEVRDSYASTARHLVELISPYFAHIPVHRIHADCHLNNLIWTPSGPTFLDFDDMVSGPAVQDLWLMVGSYDPEGRRQRSLFVEAYAELRAFQPEWLRLVEALRALRYIRYSTWIARRWHDSAFKRTWPQFGTLVYWQREMLDLREQIGRIGQALDGSYGGYGGY